MRTTLLLLALTAALACASYSGGAVRQLAAQHSNLEAVTAGECEALDQASAALEDGEDQALPLLGRAAEIEHASQVLGKQAALCWEVVARKASPEGYSPSAEAVVVQAFRDSWAAANAAVTP